MPITHRRRRALPAAGFALGFALVLAAAACSSGGSEGSATAGSGPLRVTCPAPTRAAFARSRFTLAANEALGIVDLALFEPARAGDLAGTGRDAEAARAAARRAVRAARRDLRRAAVDVGTNPPLCRTVGRYLERLDAGLVAFPDAIARGDAASAATRLRGTAQAVIAAAARQNVQLTPTVGDTP